MHRIEELRRDLLVRRPVARTPDLPAGHPGNYEDDGGSEQQAIAAEQEPGPLGPHIVPDFIEDVCHKTPRHTRADHSDGNLRGQTPGC